MKRKSPLKARQKHVLSPSPSPSEPVKAPSPHTSMTDPENVRMSAQDAGLDDLVAKLGSGENAPAAASSPAMDPAADLEIYKRLVKPVCLVAGWGIDKINRRFLKCEFTPFTDGQVAMIEDDLSFVLKDTLDKILPDMAKKNPRMVSLVMVMGMIYASNTRRIIEAPKPAETAKEAKPMPSVHEVCIETAEGVIGGIQ